MDGKASRKLGVRMWGYLPASAPQRSPILHPTKVAPASPDDPWRAVCSGGCGFALALSETGRLHTWGSTDDLGQCYRISGKHQEHPEPFPLQTATAVFAAAGWAHCAVVTETGEVYTWGWKECVPSDKNSLDQATSNDGYELQGRADGVEPDLDSSPKDSPHKLKPHEKPKLGPGKAQVQQQQSPRTPLKQSAAMKDGITSEVSNKKRKTDEAGSPESPGASASVDETMVAPPCCVPLPPGVKVVLVATGGRHTLALTDAGQVWSWGYGGEGQLGLGSRMRTVSSPQPVSLEPWSRRSAMNRHPEPEKKFPGSYVVGVACGGRHSAVLTDAGALLTFGWGLYGQCGHGTTDDELSPSYVSALGGLRVTAIAAGLWHTLCITDSGDVYSFGGNQFGQLGVGGDHSEMVPRLVDSGVLENECAKSVSCGARHSAISTDSGKVFCWGWNKYGQLGLGDTADRDTPQEVAMEHKALNVVCGWWHTLALVDQS